MAMGSQQLAADYEQLKDLLALYPNISIINTEGQPPDNYEIAYNLRGFVKDAANGVVIGENHRVRISLPFGYPYFAPVAKPLTPIFHPDFDPAAIRIADQWQQNPSLADLVLHIGEMISGNSYNLEDPFNQEAAEWYQRYQHQLPLDSLRIADIEGSAKERDSGVNDIFASLNLEKMASSGPEKSEATADVEAIRELIAQNKFYSANTLLVSISGKTNIPDLEELQQKIGKVFRKTDQLFKLAEQLEAMEKYVEAIEVLDSLMTITTDAPGVDTLRTRIQESFTSAHSFDTPPEKGEAKAEAIPEITTKTTQHPFTSKARLPFLGKGLLYKPLLVLLLILVGCTGAVALYFRDQTVLDQSQTNLRNSQVLMNKKQFEGALETLKTTKNSLNSLTILRLRRASLEQEINRLLASVELQEGLKGRVLYQGQYIPIENATALTALAGLTEQAQTLEKQNKLEEALARYRQALKFATERGLGKQQPALQEHIKSLEFRNALALAEKAEQGKRWDEAADAYRNALKISGNMEDFGTTNDITHRLTAATFRHEMDQSKKAFTQSQWEETIKFLEHAQQAMNTNPTIASEKERQDLHRLLVNSQLYVMLSTAKEAYRQKHWDVAVKEYQNALTLLERESGNMENMLGESIAKIEKTLLMVKVAQIQEKISAVEAEADFATMLEYYKEIQYMTRSSKYANDPVVKTVLQKVNDKIEKYQEQVTLNEKIAWLKEHFEEIFRANYPTSQGSKLMQPKAVLLKKIDNKSIFTLTCQEQSQGSLFKLELNYMFDASTGKWSVYKEQQSP